MTKILSKVNIQSMSLKIFGPKFLSILNQQKTHLKPKSITRMSMQQDIGINSLTDSIACMSLSSEKKLLKTIQETTGLYFRHGARSSKKVDYLHEKLKFDIAKELPDRYTVKLEQKVESVNANGCKKCDIVVYNESNQVFMIFPVKYIMSNYFQNKNNSFENLTGECMHLSWKSLDKNETCHIIPINIIFNQLPYLTSDKKIKKFENLSYNNTFKIYEQLVARNVCYDVISYIIDVKHENVVNDFYDKMPEIIGFNKDTPYKQFDEVFAELFSKVTL